MSGNETADPRDGEGGFPPVPPLAPPLGPTAPPPAPNPLGSPAPAGPHTPPGPAAPPLPPYAANSPRTTAGPAPEAPATAPLPPYARTPPVDHGAVPAGPPVPAPPARMNGTLKGLLIAVPIFLLLIVGVGAFSTILTVTRDVSSEPLAPFPTLPPIPTLTPVAPLSPAPTDAAEPDPTLTDDPEIPGTGSVGDRLEELAEQYRQARDDGTLWERIPDTERNRAAVSAFLYLITDMKIATIWGVDKETQAQYTQDAQRLEERLLAQEPLGTSVEITFEDGRVFRYDGETGEGGYTEPEG
ncbi:hypothetical protein PFZ55_27735 [Streptomyces sp. MS2A]|nr:hypothetical protein [Streptomyces sp. MS2A]